VGFRDRRGDLRSVRVTNVSAHKADRTHFDAAELRRNLLRDRERRVEVRGFDEVVAPEHFLGLGKRAVVRRNVAVLEGSRALPPTSEAPLFSPNFMWAP
jgi:hypothetical protein